MRISRALLSTTSFSSKKAWREAASLLLIAPKTVPGAEGKPKFTFLTMKRSRNSSFMPNGIVFPGGTISPADASLTAWTRVFDKAGWRGHNLKFLHPGAHRPEIYQVPTGPDELPREVSLRITAIRETFEECGILLSRSLSSRDQSTRNTENPLGLRDPDNIRRWQEAIKKDPEVFVGLFDHFSVVPDLQSLTEWSNFLTPTVYENRQRFDTIFYLTLLPTPVTAVIDDYEAESAEWSTAADLVDKHNRGEHQLMPPQLYEMTRLKDIHSVVYLEKLLDSRRRLGIERWMPVMLRTKNGQLSVLPGDDLYPQDVDIMVGGVKPTAFPKTSEELNVSTVRHNRYSKGEGGELKLLTSVAPRYGQFYNEL